MIAIIAEGRKSPLQAILDKGKGSRGLSLSHLSPKELVAVSGDEMQLR